MLLVVLSQVVGRAAIVANVAVAVRSQSSYGLSWLSSDGQMLRDELGRAVLLRGFNSAALLVWPRQPIAPLDEQDLRL